MADKVAIKELLDQERAEGEMLAIDPAILEGADLSLPGDYEVDLMAGELLGHLTNFKTSKAAWQAARNSGDHQKAEQMYRLMSYSRLAAAIIQHDHPAAKAITDELAKLKVTQAVQNRQRLAKADES